MVKRLLGEQSDLLLEGQNVFPEKLTESGFKFIYPDIKKSLYDLMQ
jgi:NAD dependent epimerase/dehydratase family enzyme